ncbi:hypothetical protein N9L47_03990 [Rhodobacteraceae bacterium]|nr:hypothetical protein [Paracoccaceae bacterium]
MAKNVKWITVNREAIQFHPVAVEVRFSDIESLYLPSRVERHDNPPNMVGQLTLTKKTADARFILGALSQYQRTCRLNVAGCDSDALVSFVRERVPKIEIGV